MGMYTGVEIDLMLHPGPEDIAWLKWMVSGAAPEDEPKRQDHYFFELDRRTFVFAANPRTSRTWGGRRTRSTSPCP
jgi:hypothetical protein